MHLTHIPLDKLAVSVLNMRHGKRPPDVSDILPSVRTRGILMPLLVRANGAPDTFEIVAGLRRYYAARTVADERGDFEPLPCHIMDEGDDASALEASLIENVHRRDADPMTQYETFTKLIRSGKTPEAVAATFGLTDRQVQQRLALGNLLPKIRDAYRKGDLDDDSVRHLTMATKRQQQDWLRLFEDEREAAPYGGHLKQWLFGGQSIATAVALFALADYPGQVIADLFGDHSYFADADLFWQKQNEAIAARRDAYLAAGWSEVAILETGRMFESWAHEKARKKDGGKVFIAVSQRGEVTFHEGYVTRREARRDAAQERAEGEGERTAQPEVSAALQTYIDFHRHAAVRAKLIDQSGVALRLVVAQAMGGSRLWKVAPEPQRSGRETTDASVRQSPAHAAFEARKAEVLGLLGLPEGAGLAACHGEETPVLFARLLKLSHQEVMRILAALAADSLEAGGALVEATGHHLGVDLAKSWSPDDAFFDLVRDKTVLNAMVGELAGKGVANANVAATGKVQKQIIRDCLTGTNGRAKVDGWLPRWLQFPARGYRKDGQFHTATLWKALRNQFAER